jgi:uncharacterized protein YecE (DUF72 family)
MGAVVKTGITAWTERSLIASGWYPPGVSSAEERLRYYASRFPIVENDSTYYAVPERRHAESWSARTPPGFTMDVKANALFTGHYTDPKRLPKDLRGSLPPSVCDKQRAYPKDLGEPIVDELARRFRDALAPLHESGKLGVVLFQYPVWFPISRENKETLADLKARFAPYRIAVEFRNSTWMSEQNRDETLSHLREHGLIYTCVDEPQGFPSSIPPIAAATGDLALLRLHGRNAQRWNQASRSAAERFDYFYSIDELKEWVPKIRSLADKAREVHVLLNNCHFDYAVRNASQMDELLFPNSF